MGFIATLLILGGLGALGYAGWQAYRRSQGQEGPEGRPPLRWIALVGVLLLLLGGAVDPSDEETDRASDVDRQEQPATTAPDEDETTPDEGAVLARASQTVKQDDYDQALTIARPLGIDDRRRVRRAISVRLASRARSALRRGERGTARRLLQQTRPFPKTQDVLGARAALTAAESRARQRRLAAQQRAAERREAERLRREAEQQAQQEQETQQDQGGAGCEAGYDPCVPTYPPDLDCGELGGPYAVTGSDPHGLDADSDGVGCE